MRLDETVILVFVLCFWMGVIALFCNKWGKIRHLEPYHPEYKEAEPTPFPSPVYSIHPKPSRMNTCTSSNAPNSFAAVNPRMNFSSFDHQRRTFSQGSRLYYCASACVINGPGYAGGGYTSGGGGQLSPLLNSRGKLNCAIFAPRGSSYSQHQNQHHHPHPNQRLNQHNHRNSCLFLFPNHSMGDTRRIKSAEDLKSLVLTSIESKHSTSAATADPPAALNPSSTTSDNNAALISMEYS